jgi:two-component system chemotaxis response regulator CheB
VSTPPAFPAARVGVLVIEDSPTVRTLLCHLIASDPRLEVVGAVESAEEALDLLPRLRPAVISMDLKLPGMDGISATRHIMSTHPTPIVVVSAAIHPGEVQISMEALRAGAVAVAEKPPGPDHPRYGAVSARLCSQLASMSSVPVVRQRLPGSTNTPGTLPVLPALPRLPPSSSRPQLRLLGIAASTGGPAALATLLGGLGADFPLPIMVVQHITPGFVGGLAAWLDRSSPIRVVVAEDGAAPQVGHCHLAPDGRHLVLSAGRMRLLPDGVPPTRSCPSGDELLRSLARDCREQAAGLILTGMGEDGALGLKALRDAGGTTLAEARSTAVVDGMPAAASAVGAVQTVLPLPMIAPRLRQLSGLATLAPLAAFTGPLHAPTPLTDLFPPPPPPPPLAPPPTGSPP